MSYRLHNAFWGNAGWRKEPPCDLEMGLSAKMNYRDCKKTTQFGHMELET